MAAEHQRLAVEPGAGVFRRGFPRDRALRLVLGRRHPVGPTSALPKAISPGVRFVRHDDFNDRFYRLFQRDWPDLCEEWQVMVAGMEYGYDVARAAIDFRPAARCRPMGPR